MLRGPISVAQLDRSNIWGLVSRVLTILVVSAVMLNFAPWLGIANLAANVLWTCLWIPKRMRTYTMETSVEIAASQQTVFHIWSIRPGGPFTGPRAIGRS